MSNPLIDEAKVEQVMVRLNGSKTSFRCEVCGCNVFHRGIKPNSYECNGCPAVYSGE